MAIDVTEQDFERVVLEGSREGPVVVDFWASWCAPCRQLGPIVERVAGETGVTLAKVDVDANPTIAGAFGVRSIPMVLAFKDGRLADEFVGALPEPEVRAFFERLAPSEADRLAAEAAAALDPVRAEELYRKAVEADHDHEPAIVGLAGILVDRGESEEARALLARVPQTEDVLRVLARLELAASANADLAGLRARAAGDPADLDAAVTLGRAEAAAGLPADALARLLDAAAAGSDDARAAMIDIFRVLGEDHPLTVEFRKKLASALF